jgi:hypothetical protein
MYEDSDSIPLAVWGPGEGLLDEGRRHLGHAPTGTRGAKGAPLVPEGQQHLLLAGVTAQAQKAMDKDATPPSIVKLARDIGR